MDIEHILVFFASPDGKNDWKPVNRDLLPDWLKKPEIVDRMIAGEQVWNTADKVLLYYKVVEIDRPRPAGQHKARIAAMAAAHGVSPGGIILPP